MKSQLFDIRREYKKGRLTPGNLNDNPFEQFDHWLNDAIHSDEYEPTAMTVATVSTDGILLHAQCCWKGWKMAGFHLLHQLRKLERPGNWLQIRIYPYLSYGTNWKGKYTLKEKLKDALLPILTPILQAGLTKVKSGRGFHPKVTSSAAVWR